MSTPEVLFKAKVPNSKILSLYDDLLRAGVLAHHCMDVFISSGPESQEVLLYTIYDEYIRHLTSLVQGRLEDWGFEQDTETTLNEHTLCYEHGCTAIYIPESQNDGTVRTVLQDWYESELSRTNNGGYCLFLDSGAAMIVSKHPDDEYLKASCTDGLLRHWLWKLENMDDEIQ